MAKYIYPAIFAKEGGFYTVRFPDLESCYTQGAAFKTHTKWLPVLYA